jgi:hypothetical protein
VVRVRESLLGVPYELFDLWILIFGFCDLTNKTNQTNTTNQPIGICHLDFGL